MKSARLESSSSPTGESSDSGSRAMRWISRTRSVGSPVFSASSSMVGSRSSSCVIWRWIRMHPVHALDHVHRDADGAGLVGDGAGDGLADPPRGVGRELEALRVVELLDRPHQAEVALLDQVEEQHPPPDVALGDRHDEAEVGLDQLGPGLVAVADDALQEAPVDRRQLAVDVAEPARASWPASMRMASSRSSSAVSRLTRPISFRYMRTVSDVPPSPPRSAAGGTARLRRSRLGRAADSPGRATGRGRCRGRPGSPRPPRCPPRARPVRTPVITSSVSSTSRSTCATSSADTVPVNVPSASRADHSPEPISWKGGVWGRDPSAGRSPTPPPGEPRAT